MNTTPNDLNPKEPQWRTFVTLPGTQPGIMMVQDKPSSSYREWYTLKNFAALFNMERDSVYQWLKQDVIPQRLTGKGRHKRPMIHRAAIPLVEKFLGKLANRVEGPR